MKMVEVIRRLVKDGAITMTNSKKAATIKYVHYYSGDAHFRSVEYMMLMIELLSPYYVDTLRPHGWHGEKIGVYNYNGKVIQVIER